MTGPHHSTTGPRARRGFSLLEIQAAFVVLGLSMAALVPFAVAQLKLVDALEKRLPPNVTYVLISQNNEKVRLLAAGGGSPVPTSTNARSLVIDQVQPAGTGPLDFTATVTVKTPTP